MWLTAMNPKSRPYTNTMATKELHAPTKTPALLKGDLHFVTNSSKHYDKDILDLEPNKPQSNKSLNKGNNQNMNRSV